MLNEALKYLSYGLSVIPLAERSKTPLISWIEFQKRRANESEVKEWFTKWPTMNTGVVTGTISKIVVVDLDGPEGLKEAERLGLKSPCCSITGRGKHLWYRNPNVLVQNAVRLYPGLDIRGEGGYIVAPPSIHESGRRYRFINAITSVAHLPLFPTDIMPNGLEQTSKITNYLQKSEGWIAKALEEMKDGNIDNTLTSILGRLRSDGFSRDDARVFLEPHTIRVKAEKGHLETKIENIWNRYEPRAITKSREINGTALNQTGFGREHSLIIHSPTNPDSIKQFEQSRLESENGVQQTISTGYPKLDQMLQGGLKSSRLFTVAARTGVGKTNWLLGVAREICRTGKSVLLFSTEMPYSEIWQRYIQTLENADEFKSHKFYVCDSFAPNLEKVEEAINEIKPDVFMFDHINHVSEEVRGIGEFMQGLNYLRRKYNCGGIITAQLNRAADWVDLKSGEKVTPRMSMIKGSGTIEQASSRVLLLSETRVTPEGTEIVGNLDKNDNGPKGLLHFMLKSNPYKMVEL
jgi:Bifunctional DNA primase/polymerase, N-terminal/DnaB-like helicase C terminal domain